MITIFRFFLFIGMLSTALLTLGGGGQTVSVWAQSSVSGLPLPRFVSLRAAEVNLRAGPGVRYPVEWVYQKRHLPVEIVAEFDTWRKIRDWQGVEGWVHQGMLSGRRHGIVRGLSVVLRSEANAQSPAVARLEKGVVVTLESCKAEAQWCYVGVDNFTGWLERQQIWGIYRYENLQ